ncbi:hypothetical protein PR003_g4114 [Phytophthora rubi]|uniref:Uncharacterized protein n=1 Tax=Phytophthora rubi TaxID=129364 RepID=A0A6A4FTT3_9STRA|nr:hypothetical protein PR003_g4114 [Phytophthora rubi]
MAEKRLPASCVGTHWDASYHAALVGEVVGLALGGAVVDSPALGSKVVGGPVPDRAVSNGAEVVGSVLGDTEVVAAALGGPTVLGRAEDEGVSAAGIATHVFNVRGIVQTLFVHVLVMEEDMHKLINSVGGRPITKLGVNNCMGKEVPLNP